MSDILPTPTPLPYMPPPLPHGLHLPPLSLGETIIIVTVVVASVGGSVAFIVGRKRKKRAQEIAAKISEP